MSDTIFAYNEGKKAVEKGWSFESVTAYREGEASYVHNARENGARDAKK